MTITFVKRKTFKKQTENKFGLMFVCVKAIPLQGTRYHTTIQDLLNTSVCSYLDAIFLNVGSIKGHKLQPNFLGLTEDSETLLAHNSSDSSASMKGLFKAPPYHRFLAEVVWMERTL